MLFAFSAAFPHPAAGCKILDRQKESTAIKTFKPPLVLSPQYSSFPLLPTDCEHCPGTTYALMFCGVFFSHARTEKSADMLGKKRLDI